MRFFSSRKRSKSNPHGSPTRSRAQDPHWSVGNLEQRLLLAADVAPAVVDSVAPIVDSDSGAKSDSSENAPHQQLMRIDDAHGPTSDAAESVTNQQHHRTPGIVFIDSRVDDAEFLSSHAMAENEVFLLDAKRGGLQQITEVLTQRRGVAAIHVIAHGDSGQLLLGNQLVDSQMVNQSRGQLKQWTKSLTDSADLLLYGCNTAAGSAGAELLRSFADLTGADVAGSTDVTGHAVHGGDWDLERSIGTIESNLALQINALQHYYGHLPITIRAAGVDNTEQMQLLINGTVAATFDNIGGDAYGGQFQDYTVAIDNASIDDIQIAFTNDFFDQVAGVDRNLRIDKITVDGVDYETEASTVFSTGTWLPADGVVPGFRESEFLHANGFFDYGAAPSGGGDGSIVQIFADGFTGEESLELRIDGQVVASYSNIPIAGRVYSFQSNEVVSADQIEIAFTNDNFGSGDPDRNLNVDKISIDGVDYETEAPTVFSTGTWKPQDGIVPGFRESETLHANGVFRYDAQSSDPDPNADPGTIVVRVAGTTGDERIELQLDGQTVATYDTLGDQANVGGFREFTFQATGPVDPGRVRIAFVNDLLDTAAGIDRNVRIDHVRIDGQIFETESPDVFSTGTWLPADGIAPGFRQSETLHANGYFQFANANNNPGFIGLGATQYTVNEDDGSITFSLTRVEGTNGPASVFYQTVSGDALSGDDFIGNDSGRVDFVDGQSTANASIALVNDDQIEGIENFSISLFRAEGAQLGEPRTAIVTIVDDESGRDLIGNWRLDESSISDGVIDSSDNANTGTFRNFDPNDIVSGPRPDAPSVASGNGGAIFFDGQNDYIQIGPDAALDVSEGTFSQSVWIKPTDNNNGTYQGVLGYQDGGTSTRYPGIWVYQQDRIHTGFGDGSNWNSFNSGSVLTVDQWNHVATTFDGTEYIIYVNGAQVASTDQYAGRTPANTNQLNIGRVDNYFEGGIDDVRIYNRALSAQEINVLIDGADLPTIPVDGNFVTETLYSGFDTPLAVDWLPDGKLVVLEQAGRLQVINPDGTRQATPLLDISDRVNAGTKDRGALGFAVHPDFENNPYVYVSYTYDPPEVYQGSGLGGPDGNGARVARIARYTVNALGTFADPDSEFVLVGNNSTFDNIGNPNIRPGLNDPHSCIDGSGNPIEDCIPADETSHTIGDLDFGTDGYLYASSGDGGSFGRVDPINLRALDIDSLAGKILRIDPITGEGPADNPFYNGDPNANQSKVYQYGLRNPFRLAVNPGDGEVFVGDVGWTTWEEINTGRGANFGWPAFEGGNGTSLETRRYRDLAEVQSFYASNPDVTAPIYARNHSDGSRAIVMGDFINSSVYPEQFQGDLVFTDIGDQVLRTLDFDAAGGVTSVDIVSDPVGFLVDFQMHSDGYLYYVDITGSVGRLQYQIG